MFNVDNIIVPTDFSDYSDLSLKRALDLAEACNAKIYLIHVVADAPDIFKLDRFNTEGQKKIMKENGVTLMMLLKWLFPNIR